MEENKKVETVKSVANLVIGIGVGAIVGNAVKATTPSSGVGAVMRICIGLGSVVLSGLASNACAKYTNGEIDSIVKFIREAASSNEIESGDEVVEAEA